MSRRNRQAQMLAPEALIDLYDVDTARYGGGTYRWTPGPMGEGAGNLIWNPLCAGSTSGWATGASPSSLTTVAAAYPISPEYVLPSGAGLFQQAGTFAATDWKQFSWTSMAAINPGQFIQAQACLIPIRCRVTIYLEFFSGTYGAATPENLLAQTKSTALINTGATASANKIEDFTLASVTATAPSGTTQVRMTLRIEPATVGVAVTDAKVFFTRAMMIVCGQLPRTTLEFAPGARVGSVSFGGQVYQPLPLRFEGVQRSGRGTVPRVTMVLPDVDGMATAVLLTRGYLLGCPITRRQVYRNALDDGSNPDVSDFFGPEIFYVDRVARHVPGVEIALECASPLDMQGTMLPAGQVIADVCEFTYRAYIGGAFQYGSCPYAGASYFDATNTSTVSASADVCSKSLAGCRARYGTTVALPMAAFPGASRSRY